MFWTEYPRDVIEVAGPDAGTYLQSQLANDLRSLQVGQSCWAFVLEPTGKVDVLLRAWRTGEETFVLDTDAGFGDVMTARLNRFKIRVKAEIAPLPWGCIAVRGVDTSSVIGGIASWGGGVDLLGAGVQPPAGIGPGSDDDLLAARIEAGWPAMGSEIVPGETIPAETGISDVAVSFTKGCYPGQELVERMDSRGATAPRSLRTVEVPAEAQVGDAVQRDGVDIGTITSVHGGRALALVKRSARQV